MLIVKDICPICEGGSVGVRQASDGASLVLMCDECEAVWLDPQQVASDSALLADPPEFRVPGRAFSIAGPASRWATRDEVEGAGWHAHVLREGEALDEG